MLQNNTSQDPDYVGPTGHEKKFHKTHFQVTWSGFKKRKNGQTKTMNGVPYKWHNGQWIPIETLTSGA